MVVEHRLRNFPRDVSVESFVHETDDLRLSEVGIARIKSYQIDEFMRAFETLHHGPYSPIMVSGALLFCKSAN